MPTANKSYSEMGGQPKFMSADFFHNNISFTQIRFRNEKQIIIGKYSSLPSHESPFTKFDNYNTRNLKIMESI